VQLFHTHLASSTRGQEQRSRSKTVVRRHGGGGGVPGGKDVVPQTSLLYFLHKHAVISCGDSEVHAFFSLFDSIKQEYISESYLVKVNDQLQPDVRAAGRYVGFGF